MELQFYGLILDFLGTVLLLLFLDPLAVEKKIHNEKRVSEEKIVRRYLMKRYFALIIIVFGFIIQIISLLR
ncbi:hypothetical protein KJA16_02145 [Patescibacteria group bacterium]|nr:hypothetical protein [Patescibacteria group bacterium]